MYVTLTESKAANCVSGWVAAQSNLPAQTALATQGKAGQGSKRVPTQVLPSALCLSLLYQLCCFKTVTLRKYKCHLPVIFKMITSCYHGWFRTLSFWYLKHWQWAFYWEMCLGVLSVSETCSSFTSTSSCFQLFVLLSKLTLNIDDIWLKVGCRNIIYK